jgi:hypothetical protein
MAIGIPLGCQSLLQGWLDLLNYVTLHRDKQHGSIQ